MPTTTPLTDAINALTRYANETTGASDTTLSDAVGTLVAGYGGGGSSDPLQFSAGNIKALIFNQATVTTDYTDNQDNLYAMKLKSGTAVSYENFFGESASGTSGKRTGFQRDASKTNEVAVLVRGDSATTYKMLEDITQDVTVVIGRQLASNETAPDTTLPLLIGGGYYRGAQESQKSNMTFYGLIIINNRNEYVARFMPWLEGTTPCVKDLVSGSLYYATVGTLGYIDNNGTVHN